MRLKFLAVFCAVFFVSLQAVNAQAPLPQVYTGSNGGAEALIMSYLPSFPTAAAQEGTAGNTGTGVGDILVSGATPGGVGLVAVSLAPADLNNFGNSLLIATDSVNLINFAFYGYDGFGDALFANVSQFNPFLAGSVLFIQSFELSPVLKSSNGIGFPMVAFPL